VQMETRQEEEVKGRPKMKNNEEESEKTVDLRRVFVDDRELKSKSQSIVKLREVKKGAREQIREVERQEEAVRKRVERKARKVGTIAKMAKKKALDQGMSEIEDLNQLC
jgi:G:T/U-mismatch repair DNA glycosylase